MARKILVSLMKNENPVFYPFCIRKILLVYGLSHVRIYQFFDVIFAKMRNLVNFKVTFSVNSET